MIKSYTTICKRAYFDVSSEFHDYYIYEFKLLHAISNNNSKNIILKSYELSYLNSLIDECMLYRLGLISRDVDIDYASYPDENNIRDVVVQFRNMLLYNEINDLLIELLNQSISNYNLKIDFTEQLKTPAKDIEIVC